MAYHLTAAMHPQAGQISRPDDRISRPDDRAVHGSPPNLSDHVEDAPQPAGPPPAGPPPAGPPLSSPA
jgi:hypothetical protein